MGSKLQRMKMTLKSITQSPKTLAIAILVLLTFLSVLIRRSSSPFISETFVSEVALVLTGVAIIVSATTILFRLYAFMWPTVCAATGALIGTFNTIVGFDGTGGCHAIVGEKIVYSCEETQKYFPGPEYAVIGIVIGLLLYFCTQKLRQAIQLHKQADL